MNLKTTKKILVIQNPVAGAKKIDFVQNVIDELTLLGATVDIYKTKAANDATDYLKTINNEFDLIAIAGGDGTVNEAINGLIDNDTPIGLIPTGTTNVMAKELGVPKTPKKIAATLMEGKLSDFYLSRLNGRRFAMFVGCGFDAWVVKNVNLDTKKRFGKLAYFISMVQSLHLYGSRRYKVEIDGKNYNALSIIIVNGRLYGGQFVICKTGNVAKPALQVMMFSVPDKFRLVCYLLSLPLRLTETLTHLTSVSGKKITISTDGDDVSQMDGDVGNGLPISIEVESAPIKVVVP
ncbi:MAG: YegS/Rv2252/BmrU family lipid kinase [Pseudomonadales bacterium]|nr:YegS/Rv2252/BmrU family lipid kinase [Pseudomonadales bacterium]